MATIQCCRRNNLCRSFVIKPKEGFEIAELLFLSKCPVCGKPQTIIKLWDSEYREKKSVVVKGDEALKLYEKQEIWQDLDKPLEDTSRKYVHGEFTKTKTRVVNHRGTVIDEWDTPKMKTYKLEERECLNTLQ